MKPIVGVAVATLLVAGTPSLQAQTESGLLTPGDVVRVDRDFVGTLMSIESDATLTVMGEGKPVCWPGIGHGDAPRCNPAPSVRRVVDWRDTTVEQLVEQSHTRRTIIGFLIGALVTTPVGYLTGPSLGYGSIDACVETSSATVTCTNPVPRAEAEARQKSQDQTRGAIFFGAVGGTIGAIVARRTVDEWVEVRPPRGPGDERGWSLAVRVPVAGH